MSTVPTLDSDLTLCDLEPITRLERIQSFGFLLAMSSDWVVVNASANLETFIGTDPRSAIGRQLDSLVDTQALHDIRNRIMGLASSGGTERLYGIELVAGRPHLDLALHYMGKLCILEGEPAGLDSRIDAASMVRKMLARLTKQTTLDAFHGDASRQIRAMTDFDRVMIYRFTASGAGEVIAETVVAGTDSFLGLHYPASDIPVQAQALYLRNPFRIIADVGANTVPLLAAKTDATPALDLSQAITRAVSPVHLEYLRNMDVGASLSISIIIDGTLWGLIACHSRTARLPTFVVLTAAELFGQMYSMTLESRLRQSADREDRRGREAAQHFLTLVKANGDLLADANWLHDALRPMIPCDGLAICLEDCAASNGSIPTAACIAEIARMTSILPEGPVFATDHMSALKLGFIAQNQETAGVLCILLGSQQYLMLFRREWLHDIRWAGEPKKSSVPRDDLSRLSPRKSFSLFAESIRGKSRPFNEAERRVAELLRAGLSESIFRGSHHVDSVRQKAAERQELLIAELNHRVRNVLALIRGLITQTSGEGGDVASYVKSLNGRVQSLARAHDRVTRQNWGPGPLDAIFEDEITAYVPQRRDRFTIAGGNILLQPQAFSTFALIIHELVTNSSKYGSLSDNGRVEVTLAHEIGKGLSFKWRECDGPPVRVPTRRGFGSVIIERMVPFDLQGTAVIQYLPAGLEADFYIPERHIALLPTPHYDTAQALAADLSMRVVAPASVQPLKGLRVLLLEDNLIVALEAEDLLKTLGAAAVLTASTIAAASVCLEAEAPHFAVLDINLGAETSLDFGLRLRGARIPFIFASGYGENIDVGALGQSILTVAKPYDREHLGMAISETLDGVGLSICRRLVDAMEGKITVKSCEGQGRHSDLKFFSIVRMRGLIRARCCRQFMRLSSMTIRSICGSL